MLKCVFMLLEPKLNTYGCAYGWMVILKNCIIGRKQHLDYSMHLVTENVHIATGSNWTIPSNYRISRILRYCCPNRHGPPPYVTIGTSSQDYRLPWAFSRRKPGLMLGTVWKTTFSSDHITYIQASDIQALWPSYHFLLSVLFSIIKGLAIAVVPWTGFVRLSDCFFQKQGLQGEYWVLLSLLLQYYNF